MKNTAIFYPLMIAAAFALSITSCKKLEIDKIAKGAWSPALAVPVGNAHFNVYDVLSKSDTTDLVVIDNTGALKLVYRNQQELISGEDFVNLPDQGVAYNRSAMDYGISPVASFSSTIVIQVDEVIDFGAGGTYQLTSVDFKQGKLAIGVSTTLRHTVKFDLQFPDVLINGVGANASILLNNPNAISQSGSDTIDLSNAIMDLTNGPNGFNEIRVTGTVTITGSGNPITSAESIDIGVDLNNMGFDLINGDFGQTNIFSLSDTIAIKLFNNISNGFIQFSDPSADFKMTNSFGIPIRVNFNEVKTKEDESGQEYPLTGFPPSFTIPSAPSPGSSASNNLLLNAQNTQNLGSIISPTPKKMIYDIDGDINPQGPANNFIKDDSKLSMEATLTLPLEGYATGFLVRDTIPFSLELPEQIDYAIFRLISNNGFPVEVTTKLYLADSSYAVIGEVLDNSITVIGAAPVDATGRVIQRTKKITDIKISQENADNLKRTKYLIIEAGAKTFNGELNQVVKIYDDYQIDVQLSALIQAVIKL